MELSIRPMGIVHMSIYTKQKGLPYVHSKYISLCRASMPTGGQLPDERQGTGHFDL